MISIGNGQMLGQRENQEDYFASFTIDNTTIGLLADGMGGYEGGELASEQSLKVFLQQLRSSSLEDIPANLNNALDAANEHLAQCKINQPHLKTMGTTFLAAVIKNNFLWWLSVGDSPFYLIQNNQIIRLNAQHNYGKILEERVLSGELTSEDVQADPDYNALSSAVTGIPIPLIDCPEQGLSMRAGDTLLLASDGILSLTEKEILTLFVHEEKTQVIADNIIEAIVKKGKKSQDNATVLILEIKD